MKPKVVLLLNKKVSEVSDACPTATVDIEVLTSKAMGILDGEGFSLPMAIETEVVEANKLMRKSTRKTVHKRETCIALTFKPRE